MRAMESLSMKLLLALEIIIYIGNYYLHGCREHSALVYVLCLYVLFQKSPYMCPIKSRTCVCLGGGGGGGCVTFEHCLVIAGG